MSGVADRVRVKICGVTNREDAELAIALGADALGFNLFAGSKRFIDFAREAEWIAELPAFVTRVAVVVNMGLEEARLVAAHRAIDCLQFHGDEDAEFCAEFAREGRPFIKAVRLSGVDSAREVPRYSTRNVLVDAHAGAAYGGTGTLIDLALATEAVRMHPQVRVILAGGLRPENVATAMAAVRPYAVDVASGVERADDPRRKDPERLRAFIAAVREAEAAGRNRPGEVSPL